MEAWEEVGDFTKGRYANDSGIFAKFYTQPVPDEVKSAEEGRHVCQDVEFVEIVAAGNANNIIKRKATSEDRQRFSRQYAMFKSSTDSEQLTGTPLSEVPWITRSQVEELNYMRIRTLEVLAAVDDNVCSKVAGLYDLKRKAKAFVDAATSAAPMTAVLEQNELMKNQLEALTAQINEMKVLQDKAAKK